MLNYRQLKMTLFFTCLALVTFAQVRYTANDQVKPYTGQFGYGTNVGYYPNWSAEDLGDISMGNPDLGVPGAGITTMRPALYEWFMEDWGYELRLRTFEHYKALGAKDNVVFIGYPSEQHRDPTNYCAGKQSELFANMYEEIWDNGENGTPVNDDNYYALYVYKTVSLYKEYVKFWEIWNEPDFSFTPNSIEQPGEPGNWWENNPDPCDYDIHAPIEHYIRLLRISYEVIKSIDEDAYVAIGGIGYPSFLDGVLRNTDNPQDGKQTSAFPLKGGAYFDVLSYHTYPHIDGSLRSWNNDINGFVYNRHTDAAVDGVIRLQNEFKGVLSKHGYNGEQYPKKEWIITESQVPRKPLTRNWGSDEIQVNFIMKALVESQKNDIKQFHIFTLGDKFDYPDAVNIYDEYHLMGLYKNMYKAQPFEEKINDVGIAYKTMSDLLGDKHFDHEKYNQLELPEGVRGGAFKNTDGKRTYVFWAETKSDNSELAHLVIDFKRILGTRRLEVREWDFSRTGDVKTDSGSNLSITGTPIFLTEVADNGGGGDGPGPKNHEYAVNVFPNPFVLGFELDFTVPVGDVVTMTIVDQFGRTVKELLKNKYLDQGNYYWSLDGTDFAPGIYFLNYKASKSTRRYKILLIRAGE